MKNFIINLQSCLVSLSKTYFTSLNFVVLRTSTLSARGLSRAIYLSHEEKAGAVLYFREHTRKRSRSLLRARNFVRVASAYPSRTRDRARLKPSSYGPANGLTHELGELVFFSTRTIPNYFVVTREAREF